MFRQRSNSDTKISLELKIKLYFIFDTAKVETCV